MYAKKRGLGVLCVVFGVLSVVGCSGHGKASSRRSANDSGAAASASNITYSSATQIAAKLRAAGLGCASFHKAALSIDIDGMPTPKDQKQCDVGNGAAGVVDTSLQVYADGASLQRGLKMGVQTACGFGATHLPYQVAGANWYVGTAYNKVLAMKVAAATGGVESEPKLSC